MKCIDCPHFKILYDPIGKAPDIWDFGRAKCEKYDVYVDFASKRKLNKLECVEGNMDLISRKQVLEILYDPYEDNEIRRIEKVETLHSVFAVPLEPLCEWLAKYAVFYACDNDGYAEEWKKVLTEWMEEQNAHHDA